MAAFCDVARRAMLDSGLFPIAGIRVRAFRADHVSVGDGGEDLAFADMVLRLGKGRTPADWSAAVEAVYGALESWLADKVTMPFALSLELLEINYPYAEKRLNTYRPVLKARGAADV